MRTAILIAIAITAALATHNAQAKCTEDMNGQSPGDQYAGCDDPPPNSSGSGGSKESYDYGPNTWAKARVSWTSYSNGVYQGVGYGPACSDSSTACYWSNGCFGTCGGYSASTTAIYNGHTDSNAYLSSG